jgi:hypothetical protein
MLHVNGFTENIVLSEWVIVVMLSWIFGLLIHWNNSQRVDMSLHLFGEEATHTNVIVFGLTWSGLDPMNYHTQWEHANNNTTDPVGKYFAIKLWMTHLTLSILRLTFIWRSLFCICSTFFSTLAESLLLKVNSTVIKKERILLKSSATPLN